MESGLEMSSNVSSLPARAGLFCLAGWIALFAASIVWNAIPKNKSELTEGTSQLEASRGVSTVVRRRVATDSPRSQRENTAGEGNDANVPQRSRLTPGLPVRLTIRVRGLASGHPIRVAVFDEPAGFPTRRNAIVLLSSNSGKSSTDLVIDDLALGTYAIAVFQDFNGDGVLNKGTFGVPCEPYGFSNNARGLFGPPSFQSAAFNLSHDQCEIEIVLQR
jgi:uncharacterized protein (DUF2141 family)